MKRTIKKIFICMSVIFMFNGCGDDLSDLNTDPNAAVEVNPATLLTTAQYRLYNRMAGRVINAEWGQLMVQYWAQNEYAEDSRYEQDKTFFNTSWRVFYADILKELNSAKELVDKQEISSLIKINQKNILDVMIAQTFIILTDGFGDVPYSEAIDPSISLPSYDSQETIYKGVLESLDNAVSTFSSDTSSFSSGDIIYNGNVDKWKKFTNSLMLRYAVRIIDVDPATATTYINKAKGNLISSNSENAAFVFASSQARSHPLYQDSEINNRDDFCVSEYLVTSLNSMNDPRLPKFAKNASGGTIVGMPYGLTDNQATELKPTTSRPNDSVRQATSPHVIISYAEVQFLLAEIYQRGIVSGNAEDAYKNAITASMNQWGITDSSEINNYITSNGYDSGNWKKSIGNQKWVALYMNGFQAWCEWRRLDYPQLSVPAAAVINSIPVKMPYALSETQNNSANLSQITSSPDNMTTKVWWDVN